MAGFLTPLLLSFVVSTAHFRTVAFADNGHVVALGCPDPFNNRRFGSKCYGFLEESKVYTYDDAATFCTAQHMHLSVPQSVDEQVFFANVIEAAGWSTALIGLRFTLSTWRWIADDSLLRGQGCNEQFTIESDELHGSGTYSDAQTPNKCIDLCSSQSANFAAVMDGSICYCSLQFVWQTPASSCSLPCTGSLDDLCGSTLNSLAFSTQPGAYDNWMPGHPGVAGSCASVHIDYSINPWLEASCNLPLPFLCHFSSVALPQNVGNVQTFFCQDGICFYLFATPVLVWYDADQFCTAYGGRLAKIDSADRQSQINALLSDANVTTVRQFWIGATNRFWLYDADKSTLVDSSYRGWINVLEPILPESNQCAEMALQSDGSYGWKSKSCSTLADTQNRFICESSTSTNETTATTASTIQPSVVHHVPTDEEKVVIVSQPSTIATTTAQAVVIASTDASMTKTSTPATRMLPAPTITTISPFIYISPSLAITSTSPTNEKNASAATAGMNTFFMTRSMTSTLLPSIISTNQNQQTTNAARLASERILIGTKLTETTEVTTINAPAVIAQTPQVSIDSQNGVVTTPTSTTIIEPQLCIATCVNVTTFSDALITAIETICWSKYAGHLSQNLSEVATPTITSNPVTAGNPSYLSNADAVGVTRIISQSSQSMNKTVYGPEVDAVVECKLLVKNKPVLGLDNAGSNNYGSGSSFEGQQVSPRVSNSADLAWWAILLIVVSCLAAVGITFGIVVLALKKVHATARVDNSSDIERLKRQPGTSGSDDSTFAPSYVDSEPDRLEDVP